MKKIALALICILFCGAVQAQVYSYKSIEEAQLNTLREDFQKLFRQKEHKSAMEKAVQVSEAFIQEKRFREAATICYQMDQLVDDYEKKNNGRKNFLLRFMATNQRLRMYIHEGKAESSKAQLDLLHYCMSYLKADSLKDNMLLSEAEYYQAFGMENKSIERYKELLQRCIAPNGPDRENCYKEMLSYAERNKITTLTNTVQKLYTAWQDSIRMVKAAEELVILQQQHETLQQDLQEKEKTISNNNIIKVGLWTVIVILAAALVVIFFILFKSMYQTRKYKNSLKIANESNAQKSHFISNINTQITPTLDLMEDSIAHSASLTVIQKNITSLRERIGNMQTYISLEESREDVYPMNNIDIKLLCESIMNRAEANFKPGVEAAVSVPRVNVKTNTEALEQILCHLLARAAFYTESGKISLEFKKRNARTGQFIITDTGSVIETEKLENLFKPFAETDPTAPEDGWILPICQLMAYKLNGTLKVDSEYRKGTRFILDLCS